MQVTTLREWKKVFESDLDYIVMEMKDYIIPKSMVILEGDLGAGKTTFCKKFIKDDETFSPSYSILSETKDTLHADLYRIESREEILHLELSMYLEDKNYFLVEWGDKYLSLLVNELPENFKMFKLEIEVNEATNQENGEASRNFFLKEIVESV